MDQFLNRIDTQREALSIVNSKPCAEPLFGLSKGAIERWGRVNDIANDNKILKAVYELGEKLSFLANKSQQQISNEYQQLNSEVQKLISDLKTHGI